MDKQLFESLNKIRLYDGDVRDLCLTFSVMDEGNFLHELITGGDNIEVTNSNKLKYIRKMVKYKLIEQIKSQCESFLAGLTSVISGDMISMFSANEVL